MIEVKSDEESDDAALFGPVADVADALGLAAAHLALVGVLISCVYPGTLCRQPFAFFVPRSGGA